MEIQCSERKWHVCSHSAQTWTAASQLLDPTPLPAAVICGTPVVRGTQDSLPVRLGHGITRCCWRSRVPAAGDPMRPAEPPGPAPLGCPLPQCYGSEKETRPKPAPSRANDVTITLSPGWELWRRGGAQEAACPNNFARLCLRRFLLLFCFGFLSFFFFFCFESVFNARPCCPCCPSTRGPWKAGISGFGGLIFFF